LKLDVNFLLVQQSVAIVNDVVAAMPAEKNPEVIKASMHIQEHGVNYQQSITYDPWTQIARVHSPHHLNIDETITLMHKPSGMMLMLNNNHKHCEYTALPEGLDPESFAEAHKEVEEEQKMLTMDLPQSSATYQGTIMDGTLTEEEREDLHQEMQDLCSGLDIFHTRKITLPAGSANDTEWELPGSTQGGRMKRTVTQGSQGTIGCTANDNLLDKCKPFSTGWGRTCLWLVCNRAAIESRICMRMYNHVNSQDLACLQCCEHRDSSTLCKCAKIHEATSFTACQRKMDYNLYGSYRSDRQFHSANSLSM